jgi:beta-lactamase regulating signal transducer with metallopeptidase domain
MNELGIAIVWLALQVSVLCLVTALFYAVVRNGNPRTRGVMMQAALWSVVPLSIVAFCPWPSWLDQDDRAETVAANSNETQITPENVAAESSLTNAEQGSADAGLIATTRIFFRSLGEEMRTTENRSVQSTSIGWTGWLAIGFLCALGVGVLRMFIGVFAVNRYARKADLVDDKTLLETFDVLVAEFSWTRKIELRETSEIVSAATIGWRRPVILLPSNWRTWSVDEQRSVMAHEIAHIVHNDFFNWLCAQIAVLLHFYHPLMHWLAGRLRLEQELAADAAAALHSGGANVYLKNLAGLAVRQHDQPLAWPARTFIPWKGTLLRRIEMLRDSKSGPGSPSMWGRGSFILSMLVAAIVLSGIRQPIEQAVAQDNKAQSTSKAKAQTVRQAKAGKVNAASLKYVPTTSVLCIVIRPAAIGSVDGVEKMAAITQQMMDQNKNGLKLAEIDQLTVIGFPVPGTSGPFGAQPVIMIQTTKANNFVDFLKSALSGSEQRTHNGAEYLATDGFRTTAYYQPDDKTMITGPEKSIQMLIDANKNNVGKPAWAAGFAKASDGHLVYAVDMAAIRPDIKRDLQRGPGAAMLAAFSPLWEDTNTIIGSMSFGDTSKLSVSAICTNKAGATKVKNTVQSLIPLGKNFVAQTEALFAGKPDVPAEVRKALALAKQVLEDVKVKSKGKSASLSVEVKDNGVPLMVALLLPAVQSAREAARRMQAKNNVKQLMLAMHNYHDTHKEFPKPVMTGPDGKTKYSWRVALLPFLEQQALYEKYNRNEPWDSENNKKVLAQIPPTYRNPNAAAGTTDTSYLALVGESTALGDGEKAVKIRDMTDGTSNTVMIFEVKRKVPWTKPVDIAYDAKGKLPEFKGYHRGGFHVGICDGSVKFVADSVAEEVLRKLITRNGGEVVGPF